MISVLGDVGEAGVIGSLQNFHVCAAVGVLLTLLFLLFALVGGTNDDYGDGGVL